MKTQVAIVGAGPAGPLQIDSGFVAGCDGFHGRASVGLAL